MNNHQHTWKNVHQSSYSEGSQVTWWCSECGTVQQEIWMDNRCVRKGAAQYPTQLIAEIVKESVSEILTDK